MGSNRGRGVTQANSQHQDLNPELFCYRNIRSVHKSEITACDRAWMVYRPTRRGPLSAKPNRVVRESANRTFASSSGPPSTNAITPPPTSPSTRHHSGHSLYSHQVFSLHCLRALCSPVCASSCYLFLSSTIYILYLHSWCVAPTV